ncbi:MAG TPA: hypothetical protein VGS58_20135 [Candidatus Sulfopaludibacter sp.]|nr:hypothetical protein [Candidatus Sulfopaludibacter sp.]
MREIAGTDVCEPVEMNSARDELSKWEGRREALSLVAGHCSAAEVESLRHIKDGRIYEKLGCTWDEYCTRHLHLPRRTADQEIAYLKRFGRPFFTLRQLHRISVREYASIAAHVLEDGVHVDGTVVPLRLQNGGELAGAIETLLRRIEPPAPAAAPDGFDAILRRLRTVRQGLRVYDGSPDQRQLTALANELSELLCGAAALGVSIGLR